MESNKEFKLPQDFLSRNGYRLPTEAEWEYVCRAKASTSRFFGSSEEMLPHYAWFLNNAKKQAKPVGSLKPNDFGLFDLYGNAAEWTNDVAEIYPEKPTEGFVVKPLTPQTAMVFRGGSVLNPSSYLRSAHRFLSPIVAREQVTGFRVARTHTEKAK